MRKVAATKLEWYNYFWMHSLSESKDIKYFTQRDRTPSSRNGSFRVAETVNRSLLYYWESGLTWLGGDNPRAVLCSRLLELVLDLLVDAAVELSRWSRVVDQVTFVRLLVKLDLYTSQLGRTLVNRLHYWWQRRQIIVDEIKFFWVLILRGILDEVKTETVT